MKNILALLVGAFVFLATPVEAQDISQVIMSSYSHARVAFKAPRRVVHRVSRVASYHPTGKQKAHQRFTDGRPRAWCGWYMRQVKGVSSTSYNVARNWSHYGRPSVPKVGAVVVWPHHVGYIVGRNNQGWIVRSGNWSNRVADVPLSRMPRNVIAYRN